MSDWNGELERDGLPRGYVIVDPYFARDLFEPVAPPQWIRLSAEVFDAGDARVIGRARVHAAIVGTTDPFDVRELAKRYRSATARVHALAPRTVARVAFEFEDAWAVPVALAAKVFDVVTRERAEAWILSAYVHPVPQESWMVPGQSIERARRHWSCADMDRGRAWPVQWMVFSHQALGHPLQVEIANPSYDRTIDVELFMFAEMMSALSIPERVGRCCIPRC